MPPPPPVKPLRPGEGERVRIKSKRTEAGGASKRYVGDHRVALTPGVRKAQIAALGKPGVSKPKPNPFAAFAAMVKPPPAEFFDRPPTIENRAVESAETPETKEPTATELVDKFFNQSTVVLRPTPTREESAESLARMRQTHAILSVGETEAKLCPVCKRETIPEDEMLCAECLATAFTISARKREALSEPVVPSSSVRRDDGVDRGRDGDQRSKASADNLQGSVPSAGALSERLVHNAAGEGGAIGETANPGGKDGSRSVAVQPAKLTRAPLCKEHQVRYSYKPLAYSEHADYFLSCPNDEGNCAVKRITNERLHHFPEDIRRAFLASQAGRGAEGSDLPTAKGLRGEDGAVLSRDSALGDSGASNRAEDNADTGHPFVESIPGTAASQVLPSNTARGAENEGARGLSKTQGMGISHGGSRLDGPASVGGNNRGGAEKGDTKGTSETGDSKDSQNRPGDAQPHPQGGHTAPNPASPVLSPVLSPGVVHREFPANSAKGAAVGESSPLGGTPLSGDTALVPPGEKAHPSFPSTLSFGPTQPSGSLNPVVLDVSSAPLRKRLPVVRFSDKDQAVLAAVLDTPGRHCNTCALGAAACAKYKENSACKFSPEFAKLTLADPNNAILGMIRIADIQLSRALDSYMIENAKQGGLLDAQVTRQLQIAYELCKEVHDKANPPAPSTTVRDSLTVTAIRDTVPGEAPRPSLLAGLFGAIRPTTGGDDDE